MSAAIHSGRQLKQAAQLRVWLDTLAIGAPAVLVAGALGWRVLGSAGLIGALLLCALLVGMVGWHRAGRQTPARLALRLDARAPELEDSARLLFVEKGALAGLALLQKQRLETRLAHFQQKCSRGFVPENAQIQMFRASNPLRSGSDFVDDALGRGLALDPRPPWSGRAIAGSWALSLIGVPLALALGWPEPAPSARSPRPAAAAPVPEIASLRLIVTPPAYTGLEARQQSQPDIKAPAGARIAWSIRFSAAPAAARLAFADGASIPLRRAQKEWIAGRVLETSTLYRIEAEGAPLPPWHRLDVIRDAPPLITVVSPSERLSLAAPGQAQWMPVFEASDDYGLEADARLRVTLASGEGEQIAVTRREASVRGTGGRRTKRWAVPLDLAREGLAPGGDLIVQLIVRDNRWPMAQISEGPSLILRQPSNAALADGLDGLLAPTMPAFFRSQRQIIIDAEALIKQRRKLSGEAFAARAQALGADQAALRFRYGQFLGESSEGNAPPPPTRDDPLPTADAPASEASAHFSGDGHDHGADDFLETQPGGLAQSVAARFGHVHDSGEAATLFDPGTRATLAAALDAMWGSERELRQARPEMALPFARRALEALKTAQAASRIYLKRTSSRLAPLDLARRLSGKREGIEPARLPEFSGGPQDAEAVLAWRALEAHPDTPALRLDALETWALAHSAQRPDPLALIAAIGAVRRDPGCTDCRQDLRAALWATQQATPTAQRRAGPDPSGSRYLEALR